MAVSPPGSPILYNQVLQITFLFSDVWDIVVLGIKTFTRLFICHYRAQDCIMKQNL